MYLYRSRHLRRMGAPGQRRVRVALASAAVAAAAGIGIAALQESPPPVNAQTVAAEATGLVSESSGPVKRQDQAAQGNRQAPGQVTQGKQAQATPGAKATQTQSQAAPSASPATPAEKDLTYQFAWQENYYFCGPAATRIALTARGLTPSQSQVAQSLGTTVNGTNSSQDTARALNQITGTSFYSAHFIAGQTATDADVAALKQAVLHAITQGYAVVANIAGSTVDDSGHSHSYSGGHYLTIVGYRDNGDTVKIADPADAMGVGSYTLSTKKMADWIAQRGYAA
ncbi:C39 family peptidase [Dactylosporangium sp. CA-233914]|uniref:C39 family peptidase n=1 Tax=Dactylosporangium sp. CA-233914 TaxID=3239934 RepID=UPI003D8D9BA1